MEQHFFLLFYDADYPYYPATYQAQILKMKYQIGVSDQSLRNWQKLLVDKKWIAKDKGDTKYFLCKKGQAPSEISEKQYKTAWRKYFDLTGKGLSRSEALQCVYHNNGGMPRKQARFMQNAFEQEKLQELFHILEESSQ